MNESEIIDLARKMSDNYAAEAAKYRFDPSLHELALIRIGKATGLDELIEEIEKQKLTEAEK